MTFASTANLKKDFPTIKISDFGISRISERDASLKTLAGTRYFMAPEIL